MALGMKWKFIKDQFVVIGRGINPIKEY